MFIFSSWMNWSIIKRISSFFICFIATKKPDFLWRAGNTFPNLPSPLQEPNWKSSILKSNDKGRGSFALIEIVLVFRDIERLKKLPPTGSVWFINLSFSRQIGASWRTILSWLILWVYLGALLLKLRASIFEGSSTPTKLFYRLWLVDDILGLYSF